MTTIQSSSGTLTFYRSVETLQADLASWLRHYDHERPHLGYRNQGRRPWETGRNPQSPFEIIAFAKQAGGNPARTIMGHIERRVFVLDDILRLADHGCVMEFYIFDWETSHLTRDRDVDLASDGARITAIRALIDAGHLARVVIAHDICSRTRQAEFGGHGYGHIYRNIIPAVRRRGFTEKEIRAILVDNPARLLAFA